MHLYPENERNGQLKSSKPERKYEFLPVFVLNLAAYPQKILAKQLFQDGVSNQQPLFLLKQEPEKL